MAKPSWSVSDDRPKAEQLQHELEETRWSRPARAASRDYVSAERNETTHSSRVSASAKSTSIWSS